MATTPTVSAQAVTPQGITVAYQAATAGGDVFSNNGHLVIRIKNGGASSITATVKSPTQCNQGYSHDIPVTIAASSEIMIGPLAPGRFNDASGNVTVQYSAVTSVTVAAVYHNPNS